MGYASRTGTRRNLAALREAGWNLLVTPACLRTEGFNYALDNGAWSAFQQKKPFDFDAFSRALDTLGEGAEWVVAPDIVAGGMESLAISLAWLDRCLAKCRRVLIAVQDGMTVEDIRPHLGPRVGIFVGGSTDWKIDTMYSWGKLAGQCTCYLHIGRVNSIRRIRLCHLAGADSFDGTSASRFAVTVPKLDGACRQMSIWSARDAFNS